MATNLSAASQARLQSAIDLLVKGSARETPMSEDVIQRIAPVVQDLGAATVGGAYEIFRDRPYTGLIALVLLCGGGVLTEAQETYLIGPSGGPQMAAVGGALGLMYLSNAYETPFAEDAINRLSPAAVGFMTSGAFSEAIRDRPVSTMLQWALNLGSTTKTGA